MSGPLEGKRFAFLVANEGIEQAELTEPWKAIEEAGGTPELVAPKAGEAQAFRHLDPADRFAVDRTTADATADRYDGLVLPGGVANADAIRMDRDAVRLVGETIAANLPIAVICHGPWILTEVDALHGRTLTSFPSLQTDLRNAGAHWVDEEVHVERGMVSSRWPDDLPAFCEKLVEQFAEGPQRPKPEAGAPLAV
jgi:protease I